MSTTITIERAEGPVALLGVKVVHSYDEANKVLTEIGTTAPVKGEGYDKVDVKVEWENGDNWSYRLDVVRGGTEGDGKNFETNLEHRLQFLTGARRPLHLDQAKYDRIQKDLQHRCPDLIEAAGKILKNHFNG